MLASLSRTSVAKTLISKSLVPGLSASVATSSSHNLITRRYKSDDAMEDDERRIHTTDNLMAIITDSINSQGTNATASEGARVSRGNFQKGDIYKPSDLALSKTHRFTPGPKPVDELKVLKLNPLVEYKNPTLLSHYISPLGRLLSREQTGLCAKNQRRLSKAVRRARAMCIISPTAKLH
ncbi:hypothetical protein BGW38_001142 [Lunasporangiospora selenospora]|uniref:Small ribosomal subunit protein bS18m n=1 Tax=Lunasporangiospora selenospora TaxID=979761 RepID=A0A9P6FUP9_9FUNG|nr:hypothetical protein BGW38_001142 [Lunasporangiospora selenospora]